MYGPQVEHRDTSPPIDQLRLKRIQQIIGVFLYYARAVDESMLCALNKLASRQANPTVFSNMLPPIPTESLHFGPRTSNYLSILTHPTAQNQDLAPAPEVSSSSATTKLTEIAKSTVDSAPSPRLCPMSYPQLRNPNMPLCSSTLREPASSITS